MIIEIGAIQICKSCGGDIVFSPAGYWVHRSSVPRHPAEPRKNMIVHLVANVVKSAGSGEAELDSASVIEALSRWYHDKPLSVLDLRGQPAIAALSEVRIEVLGSKTTHSSGPQLEPVPVPFSRRQLIDLAMRIYDAVEHGQMDAAAKMLQPGGWPAEFDL